MTEAGVDRRGRDGGIVIDAERRRDGMPGVERERLVDGAGDVTKVEGE